MSFTYAVDIIPGPKHLDLEFFNDVLENALLRNNFEIENVDFTMGSCTGENFCSQIYRVKVTYKCTDESGDGDGSMSFIIKCIPHTEGTDFLVTLNAFLKEKIVYNYVLPRMEVLCRENIKFGPRLYHSLKTPVNSLVFEDLAESHYRLGSREKGLDLAHALVAMKKLGQFHAASRKLFEKNPELIKCFQMGMLSQESIKRDNGMIMHFFGGNIFALIDLVAQWPGYEQITVKLKKYAENLKSNLVRSVAPEEGGFKVLNHADLWVNNILFKYDDSCPEKPVDMNFIDFQLSMWNSPGMDINYFCYTSLELEVLQNKFEVLIREYYYSLSESMKELDLKNIPTYNEIRKEVQKRQLHGFFAHYGIYPLICQDKANSQDSSLDNFKDEDFAQQKLKQLFASPRIEKTYRYTLEKFDKMGIFD